MHSPPSADLLLTALMAAVPLSIAELQQLHGDTRTNQVLAWAHMAADEVASHGDALQFGGTKGEAAKVFNHLARGLAALAHSPGGVLFAGLHWCVEHPMGIPCQSIADLSCSASGLDTKPRRPPHVRRPVTTLHPSEVL